MIGPTCACGHIHPFGAVVAVGRFEPQGTAGFVARPNGPVRSTREEAMKDVCPKWVESS